MYWWPEYLNDFEGYNMPIIDNILQEIIIYIGGMIIMYWLIKKLLIKN